MKSAAIDPLLGGLTVGDAVVVDSPNTVTPWRGHFVCWLGKLEEGLRRPCMVLPLGSAVTGVPPLRLRSAWVKLDRYSPRDGTIAKRFLNVRFDEQEPEVEEDAEEEEEVRAPLRPAIRAPSVPDEPPPKPVAKPTTTPKKRARTPPRVLVARQRQRTRAAFAAFALHRVAEHGEVTLAGLARVFSGQLPEHGMRAVLKDLVEQGRLSAETACVDGVFAQVFTLPGALNASQLVRRTRAKRAERKALERFMLKACLEEELTLLDVAAAYVRATGSRPTQNMVYSVANRLCAQRLMHTRTVAVDGVIGLRRFVRTASKGRVALQFWEAGEKEEG